MKNQEFLRRLRLLPDKRLQAHGVRIGNEYKEPDLLILTVLKAEYEAKALWLRYFLMNESYLADWLLNTWRLDYKPHAERILSFKRLAEQVTLTPSWVDTCRDPLTIVLHCEAQYCEEVLFNSGFLSKKALQIGSRENYSNARNYYNHLEDMDSLTFSYQESFFHPIQALETAGAHAAYENTYFKQNYFLPYLKEQKRYHRCLDKGKVQILRLKNSEPEFCGVGSRIRSKRNKTLL